MLNSKKIAITGGIASGKSTVLRFFQDLGCYVINADDIVHKLLLFNGIIHEKVIKLLGKDILVNGKISRDSIAKKVFSNKKLLKALEEIIHPLVLKEIEKKITASSEKLVFVEIPLLYEIKQEKFFDYVIAVHANDDLCNLRMQEKGFTKDQYDERKKRQLSSDEKSKRADFIIKNNGSLKDLRKSVEIIYQNLLARC
ncbi:MAG: dephospho-CoA kinase [Chlamydiota bacterium]|jgi:dephospho-CoA kinase